VRQIRAGWWRTLADTRQNRAVLAAAGLLWAARVSARLGDRQKVCCKLGHVGPVTDAWTVLREADQARRAAD